MQNKDYKTLIDGNITIDAQELKRVLKNAIKCCTHKTSDSLTRDFENYVFFDFGNKGYITIMGTNGHALYYYKIEAPEAWHNKYSFAYHRRDVAKICTYLTKIKSDTALSFKLFELKGKRTFWTKIDDKYVLEKGIRPEDECILTEHTDKKARHMPDYLSVISKEWKTELTIGARQSFTKKLKEVCKNAKNTKLALKLNKAHSTLKAQELVDGAPDIPIPLPPFEHTGEPINIGLNAGYFLNILQAYEEGECKIKFHSNKRAFGEIRDNETYIMMPIPLCWEDTIEDNK